MWISYSKSVSKVRKVLVNGISQLVINMYALCN